MSGDRNRLAMVVAVAGVAAAALGGPRLIRLARDIGTGGLGGTYHDHHHPGPRPQVDPGRGIAA